MELRIFAETVLFGRDLESKLVRPRELADSEPGSALVAPPALPGRPEGLRFLAEGESRPREARFPTRGVLGRDRDRGRVMHFFANHELLALELMALTLLRFPDAAPEFRRMLAGVMIDEQRHLELYLGRMAVLGAALGDLPCGRFFWDRLKEAPTPRHFLAGMSLGFEQANLDFSAHYLELMAEHEDQATREILSRVHDDEIRHVRRGLELFREDAGDEELFDRYREHLTFPLGPQHGRGRPFSRAARRAATLPEAFIDEMEAEAASRGRPPRLRLMNPAVEEERSGCATAPIVARIERDLALLPALVADPGDVVLVPRRPSRALRLALARSGLAPVEWLAEDEALRLLPDRPLAALAAFGRSPRSAALARRLAVAEIGLDDDRLFGKTFAAGLRARLLARLPEPVRARIVCPAHEVQAEARAAIVAAARGRTLVKPALGAAGRGQLRLRRPVAPGEIDRVAARLVGPGPFLVEDLLDRVADLSFHVEREPEGRLVARGLVHFLGDEQGGFLAAETAAAVTTLPRELQRFLAGEGESKGWFEILLEELRLLLETELASHDGEGPIGIDMLLHRRAEGGLALHPLVEINPRLTMGRIALEVGRRIRRGRRGLLAILQRGRRGDEIAAAIAMAARLPLVRGGDQEMIEEGLLLLGDDEPERRLLPVLAIGAARSEILGLIGRRRG